MHTKIWVRSLRHDQVALYALLDASDSIKNDYNRMEAMRLLSHSVSAMELWLSRLNNKIPAPEMLWPIYNSKKIRERMPMLTEAWIELIKNLDSADADANIHYTDTSGREWSNRIIDIIQHVILHGQHHRAQVSALLRSYGVEPPSTDYISNLRQGKV